MTLLEKRDETAMNYHEFMKAVDKKLLTMSEAEKSRWIHNRARTAEEHQS
ncbi:hypothetical protein [Desulfosporosinus sp. OT]|nr:hypothetical protein [Desulfosporosinus sp. OT]